MRKTNVTLMMNLCFQIVMFDLFLMFNSNRNRWMDFVKCTPVHIRSVRGEREGKGRGGEDGRRGGNGEKRDVRE